VRGNKRERARKRKRKRKKEREREREHDLEKVRKSFFKVVALANTIFYVQVSTHFSSIVKGELLKSGVIFYKLLCNNLTLKITKVCLNF
jgi:hypothetical protein